MTESANIQHTDNPPSTARNKPERPSEKGLFNRDSLLTIIGLSIPAAVYVFAVSIPAGRVTKRIRNEIKSTQQTIQSVPLRVAELNSLHKTIRQRCTALHGMDRLFPRNPDLHTVIQNAARFAEQAHLTVTRLEPKDAVDKASYRIQPFHVHLRGTFGGIVRFLHKLETSPRLVTVSQCSLVRKEGEFGDDIEVDVDFTVYVNSADNSDSNDNDASSRIRRADTDTGNVPLKG